MKSRFLIAALAVFLLQGIAAAYFTIGEDANVERDFPMPFYPNDAWIIVDVAGEIPEDTAKNDSWFVYYPEPIYTDDPVNFDYQDFHGFWVFSDECKRFYYFASDQFYATIDQSTHRIENLTIAQQKGWVWDDKMGKWLKLCAFPNGFRCGVDPGLICIP